MRLPLLPSESSSLCSLGLLGTDGCGILGICTRDDGANGVNAELQVLRSSEMQQTPDWVSDLRDDEGGIIVNVEALEAEG